MNSGALTSEATLQRTRLLLGLTDGAAVVAWADAHLIEHTDVPAALVDVSLTAPSDLSALRHALLPLATEPADSASIEAVLREVATALVDGKRSASDTVNVLRQMRRMLPLPTATDEELDALVDTLMLAEAGIGATVTEAEAAVYVWAQLQQGLPRRAEN
jgi:hypothetical protein